MQAEQTAQGHPRKTRVRRKAQPELPLDDSPAEPDHAAELLALHQQLRSEALTRHGEAVTGWPGKGTGAAKSLAVRVGKALAKHGPEACRRYIEHRAAEWREDAGPLVRYPPDQTWSPKIVDPTIQRLTGAHARASPRSASTITAPKSNRPIPNFEC
jgi:hypothetical protein